MRHLETGPDFDSRQANRARCGFKQVAVLLVMTLPLLLLGLYLRGSGTQSTPSPTPSPGQDWTSTGLHVEQSACRDRFNNSGKLVGRSSGLSESTASLLQNLKKRLEAKKRFADGWSVFLAEEIQKCDFDLVWVAWASANRGIPCAAAATRSHIPQVMTLQYLVGDTTRKRVCQGKGGELVDTIVKEAIKQATRVTVGVSAGFGSEKDSEKLKAFYAKHGFRQTGISPTVWATQQPSTQYIAEG